MRIVSSIDISRPTRQPRRGAVESRTVQPGRAVASPRDIRFFQMEALMTGSPAVSAPFTAQQIGQLANTRIAPATAAAAYRATSLPLVADATTVSARA